MLSAQAVLGGRGAWATGVGRSCGNVSILGGQGRGPCLGRVWGSLAVGAWRILYPLLSFSV